MSTYQRRYSHYRTASPRLPRARRPFQTNPCVLFSSRSDRHPYRARRLLFPRNCEKSKGTANWFCQFGGRAKVARPNGCGTGIRRKHRNTTHVGRKDSLRNHGYIALQLLLNRHRTSFLALVDRRLTTDLAFGLRLFEITVSTARVIISALLYFDGASRYVKSPRDEKITVRGSVNFTSSLKSLEFPELSDSREILNTRIRELRVSVFFGFFFYVVDAVRCKNHSRSEQD